MQRLRHHSTSTRLIAALALLTLLLTGGAGLALNRQQQLAAQFEQLVTNDFQRFSLVAELSDRANDAARKMVVLISAPRTLRIGAYAEIDAADRHLDTGLDALAKLVDGGADNPQLRLIADALARYRRAFIELADLIEADDQAGARRQLLTTTDREISALVKALQNLNHSEQAEIAQRAAAMRVDLAQDSHRLLALAAAALLCGGGIVWWALRRLIKPLAEVVQRARQFAAGDYGGRLPVRHADEVGEMAQALNQLADEVSARERQLRQMIDIDALTGLPQRNRFLADNAATLREAKAAGRAMAMVCFDVDRLKSINALLGFDAGDAVIRQAAARAAALVAAPERAGRLAGGTFAMLVELDSGNGHREAAAHMQRHLEHQIVWHDQPLDLSVTVGLALCPLHGDSAEELLRRAEQALYEGKRRHAGVTAYSDGIEAARLSHLSLLSELQQAIAQQQLLPFLQPKLCLASGRIAGAEALVRWCHPQRGWVQPGDFIPFAERTGRIALITQSMLAQCIALAGQAEKRSRPLSVAVNVSTYDLRDAGLAPRIAALLQAHQLPAERLQVEITESGLMDSGDEPIARLHALRAIGIKLSIDDFGTGQSSLAYLQRLPAQELKIDRSFVCDADRDPARRELLAAIVRLGHSLKLTVTAEGVETAGELELVRSVGCDLAQGYLIARPMPAAEFDRWLAAREITDSAAAVPA
jgi:diguanylate cyclase (GGDEF)-like protein